MFIWKIYTSIFGKTQLIKLALLFFCMVMLTIATSWSVSAGPFSDALGKCVVRSTTQDDRGQLVKFVFRAISEHPLLKSISKMTEGDKMSADRVMAGLVTRILITCKKEFQEALEYEGEKSVFVAFELLGKISMRTLMTNKNVKKAMARYVKLMDLKKLGDIMGLHKK